MKIVLLCDVDPILPEPLREKPAEDPWRVLGRVEDFIAADGVEPPPITWLIRADASVAFSTGDYASGYLCAQKLWERLRKRGDELGWHMHLMSRRETDGLFAFDPEPAWLRDAHAALSKHFPVRACRAGWGYGSDFLFRRLDALGLRADFSAMPGQKMWFRAGGEPLVIDWLRTPARVYHPSAADYQRDGSPSLRLLEVPIARFPAHAREIARRAAWRLAHGFFSAAGLGDKIRGMTEFWPSPPKADAEILAFSFHAEDLTPAGIVSFRRNVETLRRILGAQFTAASALS